MILIVNGNDWFEGGLSGGWRQAQSGLMFNNPHDTTLFHLINVENNYFPIHAQIVQMLLEKTYSIRRSEKSMRSKARGGFAQTAYPQ
jgi:hypothetical protein